MNHDGACRVHRNCEAHRNVHIAVHIKTMCPLRVKNCNDGACRNCVSTYIDHTLKTPGPLEKQSQNLKVNCEYQTPICSKVDVS